MFLSDKLQKIYNESQQFDLETCNKIIDAIADKIKEDLDEFSKMAKQRGSLNSKVISASFNNAESVFDNFAKRHPEMPDILKEKVAENISSYRALLNEAIMRNIQKK